MADRLTQLQDCLDDLLTHMYASLHYTYHRHPYGTIPGQPQGPDFRLAGDKEDDDKEDKKEKEKKLQNDAAAAANGEVVKPTEPSTPAPETPAKFNENLRELAQHLVLKEQQIEYIINSLPGIGNSEVDQEKRMRELERELREVEERRERKEREKEELVDLLGEVIGKVKRVP
ncbi:Putative mediator complex, subunit Med21, mediator complex, subunit Med7/Med21 [Septoria linicola]|uniref:Mediator of RNA polymerase II transcription subunit 21 n=1 Tax=Septoria linicola TaxID=215465 RepID=A0A9Q9EJS4_9PEZI|nr:putative mediator complex, subunit Med21, mediator complex, subunit Med7/Med21 [Septoria linicola]USW53325.1 Putative mediator complex, subunit Med21, mediator complex, subunit Med7/Med21 [Septoria linicola]